MTFLDIESEKKDSDTAVDIRLEDDTKAHALVGHIREKFKVAEDGRYSDEQRWLKAYKNYRGLSDGANQEKLRESEKSRVFVKITKVKVLAAVGQISDILFANKKFPLVVESTPVPEGIAKFAHEELLSELNKEKGGKYSSTDNIRFTQGAVFADLLDYPDGGKSLVLKDLIKEGKPEYYYRQNGAKVYTITPGDIITDAANVQFYVESVEDVGEIDDTFYVYDVQEIQRRIFDQQDGIFYLTAIRGNISPYPTGAGNQKNFHNFKFSQPISKLYPLDYKNDPVWFKQIDPNANDPGQTYSAADNYVHGLVSVNDFKGSTTKESVTDFLATEALKNNNYTGNNVLKAQEGNASAGSEDRKIPIAGDSTVVVDQRMYVELRRPSIARAGNHTFEYLGFGPGNYSTGFPARQEVLLSATQDFYSQSKKQDGGLVFYTGLNSNGDLYIGNRKIDAITGEEVFLESAKLDSSADDDDEVGNLVTTFDTPVTFNEYITVNGGENNDKTSTFNSPVTINVNSSVRDLTIGQPNIGVLSALKVISNTSSTKDDGLLDRTGMTKNRSTNGDIIIAGNRVTAGVFQFNQRGSDGSGQGYKIQTHAVASVASNITPDQYGTYNSSQIVAYGAAGSPLTGYILLKGESVGASG